MVPWPRMTGQEIAQDLVEAFEAVFQHPAYRQNRIQLATHIDHAGEGAEQHQSGRRMTRRQFDGHAGA